MDLHRLEIFCKVVDLKSFTRAAEAMLLSQPTVSEHIKHLEEVVGGTLLDRLGRDVVPTPLGRMLYKYARQMLRLRNRTLEALREFQGTVSGLLVMGASTIPATYILPRIIGDFRKQYPDVCVSLKTAGSRLIVDMVLNGDLELGFTGARWNEKKLEWMELCRDELILAAPPGMINSTSDEVPPDVLCDIPMIVRESGSGTRKVMEDVLTKHGLSPSKLNVVAQLGSTEAVKQGIIAGIGASFVSRLAVRDETRAGRMAVFRIKDVRIFRSFYVVRIARKQLSPAGRAFIGMFEARSGVDFEKEQ